MDNITFKSNSGEAAHKHTEFTKNHLVEGMNHLLYEDHLDEDFVLLRNRITGNTKKLSFATAKRIKYAKIKRFFTILNILKFSTPFKHLKRKVKAKKAKLHFKDVTQEQISANAQVESELLHIIER